MGSAVPRTAILLLASFLLAACQTDSISRHDHSGQACVPVVQDRLDALALTAADVTRISMVTRYENIFDSEVLVGFNAWVGLEACRGYVIVDVTTSCRVRQVYTRGDCRLDGVKSFR